MRIEEAFDKISEKYDAMRRKFIPCFDDFYTLPISMLSYTGEAPNVLDIGAGTGLFSTFLLEKYPKAKVTLIDLSEEMLAKAKQRFHGNERVQYITSDYTNYTFTESYDIILSALSIHHLDGGQKKDLYAKCCDMLTLGGVFLNADQALSPDPEIEAQFQQFWRDYLKSGGLSDEELEEGYARTRFDKPDTLDDQLRWMREGGFSKTDCVYKYYHWCVMYGKK